MKTIELKLLVNVHDECSESDAISAVHNMLEEGKFRAGKEMDEDMGKGLYPHTGTAIAATLSWSLNVKE